MGIVTSRTFKVALLGVALAGAALMLLFANAQRSPQSNNLPPTPASQSDGHPDAHRITNEREVVIRKLFRENMSWETGHSMGSKWYLWPNKEGVERVFSHLTDSDIPVLIEIIRTYNESGDPPTLYDAEFYSAGWALSLFKDKAQPYVQRLYELASTDAEKKKWEDVLKMIQIRKIEESRKQ